MLRHMRMRLVWGLAALTLAACTQSSTPSAEQPVGRPTEGAAPSVSPSGPPTLSTVAVEVLPPPLPPPDAGFTGDARAGGVLGGDPRSGCLWLRRAPQEDPVPLKVRTTVDRPLAVDFTRTPFRIVSGSEVIATEGDAVSLIGLYGGEEDVPGCPVTGTPFKGRFITE